MKMKIDLDTIYNVSSPIGTFADELSFKKKFIKILKEDDEKEYKVFEIENTVEPGMPDLLVLDDRDVAYFIEVKYARRGVITFKRSQIPWFKRHRELRIYIVAYNDKTKNVHYINIDVIFKFSTGTTFKLLEETETV